MIFNRLIQWIKRKRTNVSRDGDFYRCVHVVTAPSKPNEVIKVCDWNPNRTLLNIRSYVSSATSSEKDYKILQYCDGSSNCVAWLDNEKQAVYFSGGSDYCGSEVTVIVDYIKK